MEERTKHRVIGAGALAVAAAVVLPLVLRSAPPEAAPDADAPPSDPPAQSPPPPSQIRIAAITGDGGVPRAADGGADPGAAPRSEGGEGAARSANSAAAAAAPPRTAAPPRAAAPERGADERPEAGWAVQVGSFADPRNARSLRDQLASRGFEVFTERVKARDGKSRVRVLAGPDGKRADAAERLSRLRRKASIDGFIVRYPG